MDTITKTRLRDELLAEAAERAGMVVVGRFLDYEREVGVAFWAKGSVREGRQGVIFDWETRPSTRLLAKVMKYLWESTPRIPHNQVLEDREWKFLEAVDRMLRTEKEGGLG